MLQSVKENCLIDTVESGHGSIRERIYLAGSAEKSENITHF